MMRAAMLGAVALAIIIFGDLIAGLAFGGMLATGQADALGWLESQSVAMIGLAGLTIMAPARWRWPLLICGAGGSLSSVGLLCGVAARSWPLAGMAVLAGVSLLALVGVLCTSRSCAGRWVGGTCLLLLAVVLSSMGFGHDRADVPTPEPKPTLAVMTALPLFWGDVGLDGGQTGSLRSPAPAMIALGRHFKIVPVNDGRGLSPYGRLLLAQPRLLVPTELVAIDAWVRAGGRAVVLADPLLAWPMRMALGDRRRPPVTSLLDPLLTHWGLRLEAVDQSAAGMTRRFLADRSLLPVAAASRFSRAGKGCSLIENGLIALCRIGRGQVRLIADADLLDDRLWLSDPDRPGSRRAATGDTMALLAAWLTAPIDLPALRAPQIRWVRNDASLIAAVRYALTAGIIWVILGGAMIGRRKPGVMPSDAPKSPR
ncbi:hypothetical protein BH10PSE12_BH10PSE12_06480 [soil metagenome]